MDRKDVEKVVRDLIYHGRHFSPMRDEVVVRKDTDYLWAEIEQLHAQLADMQTEAEARTMLLTDTITDCDNLRKQLAEAKRENDNKTRIIVSQEAKLAEAKAEVERLKMEVDRKNREVDSQQELINDFANAMKALESKNAQLQRSIAKIGGDATIKNYALHAENTRLRGLLVEAMTRELSHRYTQEGEHHENCFKCRIAAELEGKN